MLGLSEGAPSHVAFVKAAIHHLDWPKPIDLRRHGKRLGADELRKMGLRANTVITREFLDILTDEGREDPVEAAHAIYRGIFGSTANSGQLARTAAAMGSNAKVKVTPNTMAAGPCPACIALSKKLIPIERAPAGPLPGCPHPSQCKLHWQAVVEFD